MILIIIIIIIIIIIKSPVKNCAKMIQVHLQTNKLVHKKLTIYVDIEYSHK